MNKLAFGFLFAFCLGYITNDFIHESKLSPISPAHAEVAGMDWSDLKYDYDFKKAVKDIAEEVAEEVAEEIAKEVAEEVARDVVQNCTVYVDDDYGDISC